MNNQTLEATQHLSGSIERVTFHSEESGFCVLQVKVKNKRDLMTVIGSAMSVTPGEYVDCLGHWINDKQYGLQFRAKELRVVMPSTLEGIEKYLGSGLVKGIGPHFAKRLVAAFGDKIFEVIEKTPDLLTTLPGIGPFRRDKMVKSWEDQKIIRSIIVFLQSHGVGTARAVRIYKTYGQNAIEKVTENPYRLSLDIRGIGFKTADTLAMRLGIPADSILRAQAGLHHVLQEMCTVGHCAVSVEELVTKSIDILEMAESLIREALQQEKADGNLIEEEINCQPCIFLPSLYRAEVGVVAELKRLMKYPATWINSIDAEKAIAWVEKKTDICLSRTQKEAVRLVLENKFVIITGGPGVGKTTLVNSLLKIICTKTEHVLLCAPTGRAAKRLSESTQLEAKTIHRLLEFDPKSFGFRRNENNPLDAELLVIDEMSMVDLPMMYRLLRAVPDNCGILFVGDVDQLPSVGPGMVLSNFIDSNILPVVRLHEIFRQAAHSQIIVNAHRINKGHLPKLNTEMGEKTDFYFLAADTPEAIIEKLMQVVTNRIPKRFLLDPVKDIQVLVPMNRGGLGVRSLNIELQKRLNPNPAQQMTRFGSTFARGDKVIQTINNYDKDIFNGDIGFISKIDSEEGTLLIEFEGRTVEYEADELDELSLAYATTIHKAQGSEYPVVVIPIAMQHYTLLEKNLLYTGVTRGKSLVVVIGQTRALAMAVRTVRSGNRLTNLTTRMEDNLL